MPSSNELSSRGANHPIGYTRIGCRPPPPCRAASPYSRLDHIGFGSYMSDLQPVTTAPLVEHCGVLVSLCILLATQINSLVLASRSTIKRWSLAGPFTLDLLVTMQFQALLTPVSGCFSVFPLGT